MKPTLDRRAFLRRTASAVAALPLVPRLDLWADDQAEGERAMIPMVDTHQHLWDLRKFRLPWIKEGSPLARSFLPADYGEATAGLNVVKAVYMEVDVDPAQQVAEADYVTELCRKGETRTVAAVVSGRPAAEDFKDYLARFQGNGVIKGLRQVLHGAGTPQGYCLDPRFIRGIRLLGEKGLSFDLCMRPTELADGAKLIDACPDTRFILDHCGNANVQARDRSPWQRDLAAVARRKNVDVKVSGIVASARPGAWTAEDLTPIVRHTLEVFGPDRVMFGGDWPVCTLAATYRQWVEALQTIVQDRPEVERRKLFHDNAVRFYGLNT